MTEIASSAALLLAGVLLWAAAVKLRRPQVAAASFEQLGLRAPAVLARVVPAAEMAVAALLLTRPWLGGWLALGLLAAFTAVLLPVVRSGRAVGCGCFGSSSEAPVTWAALARNGALAAAAVLSTSVPRVRPGWAGAVAVGAAAAVIAVAVALATARRHTGSLFRMRMPGGPA